MASIGSAPVYMRPGVPSGSGTARDSELDRVRGLARVLDRYFVDPLMGLVIPGVGDVIGSLLGMYVVVIAARRKVSPVIIARMLMNLTADAVIGIVPLVGDIFDIGFKAHLRNVDLLESRMSHGGRATAKDWAVVVGAALAFIAAMVLIVYGVIRLFRAVF
ncbi:MAG: DUF4112 domain-containing protein [Kofleriaceae bacterium]|nr:DUF4112 domain-containing protein [Kofleriaceae bacterium]